MSFNPSQKVIIAHYHFFKNAGTSIDTILKKNFGAAWQKVEFDRIEGESNVEFVREWLLNNQTISAFSSHTALFPIPKIDSIAIVPIVFLRHPIDRLWSAYKFERQHKQVLNFAIELAQKYNFADYLNYRLDKLNDRACRNFQTYRFSWLYDEPNLTEFEKALMGFNSLPMVGIVDYFDLSMQYFLNIIAKYFPSFQIESVRQNITSEQHSLLPERLNSIESSLDTNTYQRLLDANQDDLKLYSIAKNKLLKMAEVK